MLGTTRIDAITEMGTRGWLRPTTWRFFETQMTIYCKCYERIGGMTEIDEMETSRVNK
jgi:hypothetical protein